jgi:hypothetical protein
MMPGLLLFIGLGQIALAFASLLLPHMLRWRDQTARLEPLTRRVFWVYAGYILGTNLCLGGLTAFAPHLLLDRSPLARAVAGYGAIYWGARLVIQFVWFRHVAPKGRWYALADLAVTLAFALWTASYGAVLCDLW